MENLPSRFGSEKQIFRLVINDCYIEDEERMQNLSD